MRLPDGRIQCDGETCCQTRQPWETWFLAWETPTYSGSGEFHQRLWDDELSLWPMVLHLCSLRCASQSHDLWMQEQIRKQRLFSRNGMELVKERVR